jgi:hypothetical protein
MSAAAGTATVHDFIMARFYYPSPFFVSFVCFDIVLDMFLLLRNIFTIKHVTLYPLDSCATWGKEN